MDTSRISRITISNKNRLLLREGSADSFLHGNSSRQRISGWIEVVGSDLTVLGGNEEEGIVVFTRHLDICFITGLSVINSAFIGEVKVVAVEGGSFGVIEDCLVRELELKDHIEDESSFSGTYGK